MRELNKKQKDFCREYMVDHCATQAAIRAGYSKKTAGSQSYDLLKKPEIEKYLKNLEEKAAKRNDITVDWVLEELKRNVELGRKRKQIASSNGALDQISKILGFYEEDNKQKNIQFVIQKY